MTSKKLSRYINSYLAGLIEGNGTVYYPHSSKKTRYSLIKIAGHKKDTEIFKWLSEYLNYGETVSNNSPNSIIWRVSSKENLIDLCNRTKNYFRTSKIERMRGLCKHLDIEEPNLNRTNVLKDGWLAGMADADSNFHVVISHRKETNKVSKIKRIQTQWKLEISALSHSKESNLEWISNISSALNSKLYFRSRISKNDPEKYYNSITCISFTEQSKDIVERYFEEYPLLTTKKNDLEIWKRIRSINKKKSITKDNELKLVYTKEAERLKNKMNNKNNQPNWDHLKDY